MNKAKRNTTVFQEELLDDETILWFGKPQAWRLLNSHDLFLIPFSLFWCAFVFSFLQMGAFGLFILPHTLIGLYMLVGRFIVKYLRNKNTYYAVTNERILIATRLLSAKFQAVAINTLPALNKSVSVGGVGTINFGLEPHQPWWSRGRANYSNTGMEFFGYTVPGFYDIADANEVYRLISELRHAQAAPVSYYDEPDHPWKPAKRKAYHQGI